jgi:hypothetical protein
MQLSGQQVHSSPSTLITGMRGLVSILQAVFGTGAWTRPKAPEVRLRHLMTLPRAG